MGRFYLKGERNQSRCSRSCLLHSALLTTRASHRLHVPQKNVRTRFVCPSHRHFNSLFASVGASVLSPPGLPPNLFLLQAGVFIDGFDSGDLRSIDETCAHVFGGLDVISSMVHLGGVGGWGVLDPEPSGGSGEFRGYAYGPGGALFGILVLDRNLWDLSCVYLHRRQLRKFFLPRLLPVASICRISFSLLLLLLFDGGGGFANWELIVGNDTTGREFNSGERGEDGGGGIVQGIF